MPPEKMILTLFAPCAAQTLRGFFEGFFICLRWSLYESIPVDCKTSTSIIIGAKYRRLFEIFFRKLNFPIDLMGILLVYSHQQKQIKPVGNRNGGSAMRLLLHRLLRQNFRFGRMRGAF
ncbi:MAG: hypothetical protein V8S89_04465 [Oscillospiraceae bacterium]